MLKQKRKELKMSQKTFAKRLNISQSYLSQLENNERYNKNVNVKLIKKISKELDIDHEHVYLFFYNTSK